MPMPDREKIRAFLEKVATDPAYREQLLNEPMPTLTQTGFTVSSQDLPPGGITLPTNAEILANLDGLSAQVEGVHWYCLSH